MSLILIQQKNYYPNFNIFNCIKIPAKSNKKIPTLKIREKMMKKRKIINRENFLPKNNLSENFPQKRTRKNNFHTIFTFFGFS
jgi:hypothetical protein